MHVFFLVFQGICTACEGLFSVDDKHKVPVGEHSYPIAATERGHRVIVQEDERFIVDHD